MKMNEYTYTTSTGEPLIIHAVSAGKCDIAGHMWTFAGKRDYVPEGTPCDCGMTKYIFYKPCSLCGK